MKRMILMSAIALLGLGTRANAQNIYVGPGSTAQGDILRGEGIAAWGWGQYNLNTAKGNSINADTWMRLSHFVMEARKAENARQARIRARDKADHLMYFNQERYRLLKEPEGIDIHAGRALNAIMDKLQNGPYSQSERGATKILIPVDIVRRIPFSLGETGHVISPSRMLHYSKSWPVAFRDEKFAGLKRRYDRAINRALCETWKSDTQQKTIGEVAIAVEDLRRLLISQEATMNERSFKEGIRHLADLKEYPGLFGSQKPQEALLALDTYSGTSVEELRKFMDKYSLRFAPAERPGEREAYREIYTALHMQGDLLSLFEQAEKKREEQIKKDQAVRAELKRAIDEQQKKDDAIREGLNRRTEGDQ